MTTIKRLALCVALAAALVMGGVHIFARAQTVGCGSIYGLGLITTAFAQTISQPCGGGPTIVLSNTSIVAGSADGTTLGTVSISGTVTGTASWSLTDGTGTFQINSSTGIVTVLNNTDLTGGNTIPIVINVSGVTPTVSAGHFTINVTSTGCTAGALDLSLSTGCNLAFYIKGNFP